MIAELLRLPSSNTCDMGDLVETLLGDATPEDPSLFILPSAFDVLRRCKAFFEAFFDLRNARGDSTSDNELRADSEAELGRRRDGGPGAAAAAAAWRLLSLLLSSLETETESGCPALRALRSPTSSCSASVQSQSHMVRGRTAAEPAGGRSSRVGKIGEARKGNGAERSDDQGWSASKDDH